MNFYRNGCDKETALRESEKFWLYFTSKGWNVGKSPMKNWPAACATWRRNMAKTAASKNISQPRELQSCKIVKTETDETAFRVVDNGKVFEFDKDHPPLAGTALWLAWNNWRATPESYRKTA